MRFIAGAIIASLVAIALHIWGGEWIAWLFSRGDS